MQFEAEAVLDAALLRGRLQFRSRMPKMPMTQMKHQRMPPKKRLSSGVWCVATCFLLGDQAETLPTKRSDAKGAKVRPQSEV